MKFLKMILALALLPCLVGVGRAGVFLLSKATDAQWPWLDVALFALGFSTLFFAYLCLPRGNWFYVLGHETTHAVAVLLSGGKVSGFKVSSQGGHVISDRNSPWIALSPYFIPFYPALIGLIWISILFFQPKWVSYDWAFLLIWGASWGFHFCHTLSLLKTRQPDFASQGYFFSFVIIALLNLLILETLLWFWLKPFPAREGLLTLGTFISQDYLLMVQLVKSGWSGIFPHQH
jgi:hypothetical protein